VTRSAKVRKANQEKVYFVAWGKKLYPSCSQSDWSCCSYSQNGEGTRVSASIAEVASHLCQS
jgi:hypothetical protein